MALPQLKEEPIFGRISILRPFFGHFHIIENAKSKIFLGYGLYKCISEEKIVKKKLQKKWHVITKYPLARIFRIFDWL